MSPFSQLDGKRFNGYLRIRLPHPLDAVVHTALAAYRDSSPADRALLIDTINPGVASVLNAYGERMAAMAIRSNSLKPLHDALLAVGIAQTRLDDWRDTLYSLVTVNHSAGLLGTDLDRLIGGIANDLPQGALDAFRTFTARADRDKSLACMGLAAKGSGAEFRYVPGSTTW